MKDNKLPRGVTHSLLAAVMQAMKHDSSMSKVISPKVKVATPKTDPIGKEDKDINNDGKVNNTDGFLAARRRAIAARVAKMKGNKNTNTSPKIAIKGKKDSVDVKPALGESMTSEQYDSEVQWALRSGLTPPIRPAMFAEAHTQCGTPDCCGQCDTTQVNEAAMSDDAHELMIHGDNNSQLYKSSYVPVAKNLEKKWKKGTYDHEKAKKLWKYHADRASESYKKEHGHMFSPAVRREAAGHYADHHKAEMEAGNMHESLSEAMAMRRRVNQERADSGDFNVLNQLRKIRPTSSKTIRWADGSKSDITLAHRDAALAKHAEVMGGRGPGSYGPDKQAFLKMLGSNEKGFHGALAGKHTERSTVAGFKVPRKGIDEVITAKTPTSDVISDFVHSKNPKFADKSKAKRIQMALAASYAKKRGN